MDDPERTALDLLIIGFQVSQMLRVVADLGLADRVPSDGQASSADLASLADVHSQPLLRVLRALASLEIFAVSPDGIVRHTARSMLLRTDIETPCITEPDLGRPRLVEGMGNVRPRSEGRSAASCRLGHLIGFAYFAGTSRGGACLR